MTESQSFECENIGKMHKNKEEDGVNGENITKIRRRAEVQ